MTDIHHPSHLLLRQDDPQANPAWTTMIGALIAILLVIGAAHLIEPQAGDASRVQGSETGDVKLDGRGKWTGYM
ncbi:hypothetical protein [Anderseniella sp. Alg231-50]|uniref:hypothetical protein n=1 Tax=Anderseniella sp. Alg231-50 TaxID=1922226 RepID=UPI00307C328C